MIDTKERVKVFLVALIGLSVQAGWAEPLPGSKELDWEDEDFSVRIMDGAHAFVEEEIETASARRFPSWRRDLLAGLTTPSNWGTTAKPYS